MKAAAYIRAEAPADHDRQLALIRQRAEASGWELLDVYADPSGRRGHQPGFRRLLAAAEQRTVDVLIIERLDRLASSLRALVEVFEEICRCRVALVSLYDEIDTSIGDGGLVFHLMRAVGQFERRRHGQRIRLGLARARGVGTRLGRPPADVNPADVVRLRAQGLTYRQVGRRLGISAALAHRLARTASGDALRPV